MSESSRWTYGVLTLGVAATAVGAAADGVPAADLAVLVGIAVAGAVAGGGFALLFLRSIPEPSIRTQAVAVASSSVAGTAIGVLLAAQAMFVSRHDLTALFVVLAASTAVSVGLAWWLGGRIGMASRDLEDLARRLGDGDVLLVGDVPVSHELRRLATELQVASARLDEARTRERSTEAARRQLVAWVSHDLRTPLAAVRAMLEAIDDGVVDHPADVADYHARMRHEVERLGRLIDDLFELSRIEAGALRLRLEAMPLADLVGDAVAASMALATARGVEIRGVGVDSGATAMVSAPEFSRVLQNLLENAIRYTPEGGTVAVECGEEDDAVVVSVADSCGGIDDDDLSRVFDVAYRGDSARGRSEHVGGGLGLAIAKGLVHAHQGEIAVANEGRGCRFSVRIPSRPAGADVA